ncbi:MAG: aromatic ring-hydroxylating dioxygenase subunit alpha [Rhodospirillales bacterium]|nr:aromatic ring-hydroxylating dioxygenase subunit alpha [Rhodospirillales bacterium]
MGELMRRFWIPGLKEEEIAAPDSPPVKLRLLGEDLVAFKDSDGRIGILDAYCPHRMVELYYGRNEECGLRCVYHGWKFDTAGNCVDMPSEPNETNFAHKVTTKSYPAAVRAGVVWIYMGPKGEMPELPEFEWSYLSADRTAATKRLQQCNWAQAIEGGIDSAHISFLHSNLGDAGHGNFNLKRETYNLGDRHPKFFIEDTDYGLQIGARRGAGENRHYWRITQCLMPFYTMIPPTMEGGATSDGIPFGGHAWVPIDDENTWTWSFGVHPNRPFTKEEANWSGGRDGTWGPIDDNYRPIRNKDNDYLLDREAQRTRNYTGIDGVPNQDAAVQESMGPIVDRARERLGASDIAIITWRKKILQLTRDLEAGTLPPMAGQGNVYNVRSCSALLNGDADWIEATAELVRGGEIQYAAE